MPATFMFPDAETPFTGMLPLIEGQSYLALLVGGNGGVSVPGYDPSGAERYGGGKFKMNLHHGLHFVNTKNFKPEGAPRWKDAPELVLD